MQRCTFLIYPSPSYSIVLGSQQRDFQSFEHGSLGSVPGIVFVCVRKKSKYATEGALKGSVSVISIGNGFLNPREFDG